MMGRRSPLTSMMPFPRRDVNIATVAQSEDTSRMTPGRGGPLFACLWTEGEDACGAGGLSLFDVALRETEERRELSKKKLWRVLLTEAGTRTMSRSTGR